MGLRAVPDLPQALLVHQSCPLTVSASNTKTLPQARLKFFPALSASQTPEQALYYSLKPLSSDLYLAIFWGFSTWNRRYSLFWGINH